MREAPAVLRAEAETLSAPLPAMLAEAQHLAATVVLGEHGRRRPGQGADFWQYRAAMPGDDASRIDWRRSGRADVAFVQDKEWQTAQTVMIWVDRGRSMDFGSSPKWPTKAHRARLLALASAILLARGGERVGMGAGQETGGLPPRRGPMMLDRLAAALSDDHAGDYGAPGTAGMPPRSRALFVSDFLGDPAPVERAVAEAADRGIKGALLQVLDPQEEAFPFEGRTIFESMGGGLRHETLKAGDLRGRYLARLAERKARLQDLARATGWMFTTHHTDAAPAVALLWLHAAMGRQA
ncbi:MAG: FIG139612: Possible conserved membrane protein [uncultured Rubellimicrobium sp.]|uniref:FIG139612: Possible conserved membrane protein n=1 Tax=uncultured Rubellimicrobium sp. TaxID=543078 RepID=A0A6J4Q1T9_9RHOB|nr:MAG: FIG139612: Possible conserved membrane protein [uncultured Rubellimicrobium sp.]